MTSDSRHATTPVVFPAARRRTALEFVYESLREAILTGALRGGSRLVQSALAESLGVSNTPVREALRDLASEGLVTLDNHRGAEVRRVLYREIQEIYDVREALEPLLMKSVVQRITPEAIEALKVLHRSMVEATDPSVWITLYSRFHTFLIDEARWSVAERFLRSLQAKVALFVGVELQFQVTEENADFWPREMQIGNTQYGKLLRAFENRDADQAAEDIVTHLQLTFENIHRVYAGA